MKNTGIVRKLDHLGRITLPIELRRTLGVSDCDPLEIHIEGDTVVLKPHLKKCKHCETTENLIPDDEFEICWDCAGKVAKKLLSI